MLLGDGTSQYPDIINLSTNLPGVTYPNGVWTKSCSLSTDWIIAQVYTTYVGNVKRLMLRKSNVEGTLTVLTTITLSTTNVGLDQTDYYIACLGEKTTTFANGFIVVTYTVGAMPKLIYAKIYDEDLTEIKTEFEVAETKTYDQIANCVAIMKNKKTVIFGFHATQGTDVTETDEAVFYRGYQVNSDLWHSTTNNQINFYTNGNQNKLKIIPTGVQSFTCIYEGTDYTLGLDGTYTTYGKGILGRKYVYSSTNGDGTYVWQVLNEQIINETISGDQYNAVVGVMKGFHVIIWTSYVAANDTYYLMAKSFKNNKASFSQYWSEKT